MITSKDRFVHSSRRPVPSGPLRQSLPIPPPTPPALPGSSNANATAPPVPVEPWAHVVGRRKKEEKLGNPAGNLDEEAKESFLRMVTGEGRFDKYASVSARAKKEAAMAPQSEDVEDEDEDEYEEIEFYTGDRESGASLEGSDGFVHEATQPPANLNVIERTFEEIRKARRSLEEPRLKKVEKQRLRRENIVAAINNQASSPSPPPTPVSSKPKPKPEPEQQQQKIINVQDAYWEKKLQEEAEQRRSNKAKLEEKKQQDERRFSYTEDPVDRDFEEQQRRLERLEDNQNKRQQNIAEGSGLGSGAGSVAANPPQPRPSPPPIPVQTVTSTGEGLANAERIMEIAAAAELKKQAERKKNSAPPVIIRQSLLTNLTPPLPPPQQQSSPQKQEQEQEQEEEMPSPITTTIYVSESDRKKAARFGIKFD